MPCSSRRRTAAPSTEPGSRGTPCYRVHLKDGLVHRGRRFYDQATLFRALRPDMPWLRRIAVVARRRCEDLRRPRCRARRCAPALRRRRTGSRRPATSSAVLRHRAESGRPIHLPRRRSFEARRLGRRRRSARLRRMATPQGDSAWATATRCVETAQDAATRSSTRWRRNLSIRSAVACAAIAAIAGRRRRRGCGRFALRMCRTPCTLRVIQRPSTPASASCSRRRRCRPWRPRSAGRRP